MNEGKVAEQTFCTLARACQRKELKEPRHKNTWMLLCLLFVTLPTLSEHMFSLEKSSHVISLMK